MLFRIFIIGFLLIVCSCKSGKEQREKTTSLSLKKDTSVASEKLIVKANHQSYKPKDTCTIKSTYLFSLCKLKNRKTNINISEIQTHDMCFILSDSIPIYQSNNRDSDILTFGKILVPYKIVKHHSDFLEILVTNESTGFITNDSSIYTLKGFLVSDFQPRIGKNYIDLIYEVWENTNNKFYELELKGIDDSCTVHYVQYFSGGPYYQDIPYRASLFLNAVKNLSYRNKNISGLSEFENGNLLIRLWSCFEKEYPFLKIDFWPADVYSQFQIAEIFDKILSKPDSSAIKYLDIVSRFKDRPIGGDEWNNKADVWAFMKFVDLARDYNFNNNVLEEYYSKFINVASNPLIKAVIQLQTNEHLMKNGKYSEAEKIWKSIINDKPLLWSSFKSTGDLRGGALLQWKKLGLEFIGDEYVINSFNEIIENNSDPYIIWVTKYILAHTYEMKKDTLKIIKNIEWCLLNNKRSILGANILTTTIGNFSDFKAEYFLTYHKASLLYKKYVKPIKYAAYGDELFWPLTPREDVSKDRIKVLTEKDEVILLKKE